MKNHPTLPVVFAAGFSLALLAFAGCTQAGEGLSKAPNIETSWKGHDLQNSFIELPSGEEQLLLEAWIWKVGPEALVFRVTVFGDVFTQHPDGSIWFLDIIYGDYYRIATSPEDWMERMKAGGRVLLHWDVLQDLRSREIDLPPGKVYDWIHSPLLGGEETVDNIQFMDPSVSITYSGRHAEAVAKQSSGETIDSVQSSLLPQAGEESERFDVVINEELQYSIWPEGRELPSGWQLEGMSGSKQDCMDHIAEVWTDMRPLSTREKLDQPD